MSKMSKDYSFYLLFLKALKYLFDRCTEYTDKTFNSSLRPGMLFECKHEISFDRDPGDASTWEKINKGDRLLYLFSSATGAPVWLITAELSEESRVREIKVEPYKLTRLV